MTYNWSKVADLYHAQRDDSEAKPLMGADFILSQVTEIILTLEENELQVDVRDELPGIIATSLKIKI